MSQTAIVIPARYQSSRFPGKALAPILGKPMIEHVYFQAKQTPGIGQVIVATDDQRIVEVVRGFGETVWLTSGMHTNGTQRVAEVAADLDAEYVINAQGDEPLIAPEAIRQAVQPLWDDPEIEMGTLVTDLSDQDGDDLNVVKVAVDDQGFATSFSRRAQVGVSLYKHVGLYAFRRRFLLQYQQLPETRGEAEERLEQLRVLENGYRIKCTWTQHRSEGVDTPAQLEAVTQLMRGRQKRPEGL